MHTIYINNKPVNVFADILNERVLGQLTEAVSQESVIGAAVMPDVHSGYTLPIGSVVKTVGVVYPAWVGYDIGCGVSTMRLHVDADRVRKRAEDIRAEILRRVPVGPGGYHRTPCYNGWLGVDGIKGAAECDFNRQIGTLGGGNHFIEVGYSDGDDSAVWLTVHTGSRGVGHSIASHFMALAAGAEKPVEASFGFDAKSDLGRAYLAAAGHAETFAFHNRQMILRQARWTIEDILGEFFDAPASTRINRSHNHVEEVCGAFVHRKGATHAEDGMLGVIPGNMRDGVFVVRGKGNSKSLCSSSHGAGRVMSRSQAHKTLDYDAFAAQMDGIVAYPTVGKLDEAPGAYKDIFEVMRQQTDLVEVLHHIKPILNVKG